LTQGSRARFVADVALLSSLSDEGCVSARCAVPVRREGRVALRPPAPRAPQILALA